jgi:hypothetical protein
MELYPLYYYATVTGVGECVAQALADHEADGTLGRPGRVVVVPGSEVPWDGCECGQLGFAFAHGPFPIRSFPVESVEDPGIGRCVIGSSAVRVTASLIRCQYHPGMQADGQPPTVAAQQEAARLQQIEQFYMREAIQCCLSSRYYDRLLDDYRVGSTDYQVNGNCGETSMVFYLGND